MFSFFKISVLMHVQLFVVLLPLLYTNINMHAHAYTHIYFSEQQKHDSCCCYSVHWLAKKYTTGAGKPN